MKVLKKLGVAVMLSMALALPAVSFNVETKEASAAALMGTKTGYTKASDVNYVKNGSYVANWGARDEDCVFLSEYAEDFYSSSYSYDVLSQKKGSTSSSGVPSSALYSSLQTLMKSKHKNETSYNATRDKFKYTDCVNSNYNNISSFYSGKSLNGAWDGGSTWNREHTWPNSKGNAAGNGENDIMMLRPASVSENSSRGNKAYGEGSGYYDPNGEGQSVRGDCARIVLYQYVRWQCTNTGSKYNPNGIFGTNGVIESVDVLLRWMEEDPVDTWELGRNDSVQSITGTRNVFVDYPELAFLLFGEDIPDMQTPSLEASGGCNHTYDNDCDADCNGCGAVRDDLTHTYDHSCDTVCNFCNHEREPGSHVYSAFCDATCENCGYEREASCRYAKWTIIVAATETEAGLEKSTCIYCKEETEREIPKLDPPKEEPEAPPAEDTPNEEQPTTPPCINNGGAQEIPTESEPQGFFEAIAAFFQAIFDMIASLFKF